MIFTHVKTARQTRRTWLPRLSAVLVQTQPALLRFSQLRSPVLALAALSTVLLALSVGAMACTLTGAVGESNEQADLSAQVAASALSSAPMQEPPMHTLAPVVTMTIGAPGTRVPTRPARDAGIPVPCGPGDEGDLAEIGRTRYSVDATIDTDAHTVDATLQLTYVNSTGQALSTLVFHVDHQRSPGAFELQSLVPTEGYRALVQSYLLDRARLEVAFADPLAPGCPVELTMQFHLNIPALADARMRYFAYTPRQINLGHWMPEIAPFVDGEWRVPAAWGIGEYTYGEVADFDVRVTLNGRGVGGAAEHSMQAIAPGEVSRVDGNTQRFLFRQGRTFPLTISDQMTSISTQTAQGTTIDLYYFRDGQPATNEAGEPVNGPTHALEMARQAAEFFHASYGPLPYSRVVVIEADFDDGQEFSGMVYVGTAWFSRFNGLVQSWLTLITIHEMAHQWWHAAVSSDQGNTPYLDESLPIFSEILFLEHSYPTEVEWWWQFRVMRHNPEGDVDAPVYEYWNVRLYINAIYLRAALMLRDIRERIGATAFADWLRRYYGARSQQIATAADFWGALPRADYERIADIRDAYLRNPDPLGSGEPVATP